MALFDDTSLLFDAASNMSTRDDSDASGDFPAEDLRNELSELLSSMTRKTQTRT